MADSLSRCPTGQPPAKGEAEDEFQVAQIDSKNISPLLEEVPSHAIKKDSLLEEQQKDPWVKQMINYLENGLLPTDDRQVKKLVNQAAHFALVEDILYFIDSKKGNRKRAVVPLSLRKQIMEEVHGGKFGGHFSGPRTYNSLVYHWWWEQMYSGVMEFCKNCPQCAIVSGVG